MPKVAFSQNILRHLDVKVDQVNGATVGEAMEAVFVESPRLRNYLFDDDGAVRKHIAFVVNSQPVKDRLNLSDAVGDADEIFVMQALSGG